MRALTYMYWFSVSLRNDVSRSWKITKIADAMTIVITMTWA